MQITSVMIKIIHFFSRVIQVVSLYRGIMFLKISFWFFFQSIMLTLKLLKSIQFRLTYIRLFFFSPRLKLNGSQILLEKCSFQWNDLNRPSNLLLQQKILLFFYEKISKDKNLQIFQEFFVFSARALFNRTSESFLFL